MSNLMYGLNIYGQDIYSGPPRAGHGGSEDYTTYPLMDDPISSSYIVIYDKQGNKLAIIGGVIGDNPLSNWEFVNTQNGCADFELTLLKPILENHPEGQVDLSYYHRVDFHLFGDFQPWFSGVILTVPRKGGTDKEMTYTGYGYFQYLSYLLVTDEFKEQEISSIARQLMTSIVEPNCPIIFRADKIQNTNYIATHLGFEYATVKEVFEDLTDMAQNFIFGVDEYREAFVRQINTDINENSRFWVGYQVEEFYPEEDESTVYNHIFVNAGTLDEEGSGIIYENKDLESIGKYGLKQTVIDMPAGLSVEDAQRFGDYQLSILKNPTVRAEVSRIKPSKYKIRSDGLARITSSDGTQMFSLPIVEICYTMDSAGLSMSMQLGECYPDQGVVLTRLLRDANNADRVSRANIKQIATS